MMYKIPHINVLCCEFQFLFLFFFFFKEHIKEFHKTREGWRVDDSGKGWDRREGSEEGRRGMLPFCTSTHTQISLLAQAPGLVSHNFHSFI